VALTAWEMLDDGARSVVRDTFGVAVTYTPASGSAVSTLPDGSPLKGEFTPLYEDTNPSDTAAPASGPRIEFKSSDLAAIGITDAATMKGKRVTFAVRSQTRTWYIIDAHDADVGSVYCWLGDREVS
jgi:hypothetical protein